MDEPSGPVENDSERALKIRVCPPIRYCGPPPAFLDRNSREISIRTFSHPASGRIQSRVISRVIPKMLQQASLESILDYFSEDEEIRELVLYFREKIRTHSYLSVRSDDGLEISYW